MLFPQHFWEIINPHDLSWVWSRQSIINLTQAQKFLPNSSLENFFFLHVKNPISGSQHRLYVNQGNFLFLFLCFLLVFKCSIFYKFDWHEKYSRNAKNVIRTDNIFTRSFISQDLFYFHDKLFHNILEGEGDSPHS